MHIKDNFELETGTIFKNRLCKAAMTEGIANSKSFCNQRHVNLYDKWAKGGIGLSITGNVQVDRRFMEGPGNVVIEKETYKDQLDELKKVGQKLVNQMEQNFGCRSVMREDKHPHLFPRNHLPHLQFN